MGREFDLINRYFSRAVPAGYLGGGDDCALLPVSPGKTLAVSTDLLVEGRHFFPDVPAHRLGHKALAVNLSDLAAMGATPLGCVLGLAIPSIDDQWLAGFSSGFYNLADRACCPLVGGDTTWAEKITLSVTVFGEVDAGQALRRAGARVDDDIWVTGTLGAPHIALLLLQDALSPAVCKQVLQHEPALRQALELPEPPLQFGARLAGLAHAALDISDGFLQDLGHILTASGCGAVIQYDCLPVHPALSGLPESLQQEAVLSGGDVYQLCFTAPPAVRDAVQAQAVACGVQVTRVGRITAHIGQQDIVRHSGATVQVARQGFQHF